MVVEFGVKCQKIPRRVLDNDDATDVCGDDDEDDAWQWKLCCFSLFRSQMRRSERRLGCDLATSGPWTLGGGLLIFFPHISSLPDTYYFLCLGAMAWIHLTPPACMNKYTPTKFAVAPPFIVQGLTESIFVHPWFEWTVWTNNCIKHSRWLIITRPQPHKCITPLPVVF